MIKKILKLVIPIIALLAGAAGGLALKPSSDSNSGDESAKSPDSHTVQDESDTTELDKTPETHAAHDTAPSDHDDGYHGDAGSGSEMAWFNFSRQFFVPLVRQGDETSVMIILSIALETDGDNLTSLNDQEIRLRDIVLRQLLIAANTGRFDGNFTTDGRMRGLRKQILSALQEVVGNKVTAVLISDIARQDD